LPFVAIIGEKLTYCNLFLAEDGSSGLLRAFFCAFGAVKK